MEEKLPLYSKAGFLGWIHILKPRACITFVMRKPLVFKHKPSASSSWSTVPWPCLTEEAPCQHPPRPRALSPGEGTHATALSISGRWRMWVGLPAIPYKLKAWGLSKQALQNRCPLTEQFGNSGLVAPKRKCMLGNSNQSNPLKQKSHCTLFPQGARRQSYSLRGLPSHLLSGLLCFLLEQQVLERATRRRQGHTRCFSHWASASRCWSSEGPSGEHMCTTQPHVLSQLSGCGPARRSASTWPPRPKGSTCPLLRVTQVILSIRIGVQIRGQHFDISFTSLVPSSHPPTVDIALTVTVFIPAECREPHGDRRGLGDGVPAPRPHGCS